MYDNIGGKIKGLAKGTFIVEAIGAIIAGFAILNSYFDDKITMGLLSIFVGPIVAWISSWILYAFGELVEKTHKNEDNTRQILEVLQRKSPHSDNTGAFSATYPWNNTVKSPAAQTVDSASPSSARHSWRCDNCGKLATQSPCEYCGKK